MRWILPKLNKNGQIMITFPKQSMSKHVFCLSTWKLPYDTHEMVYEHTKHSYKWSQIWNSAKHPYHMYPK